MGTSPGGSEAHAGTLDALQSYVGPPGGRPAENTFTPKGQTTPDYARGDALITLTPSLTTSNVAEGFMAAAGTAAGAGSWSVSVPLTLSAAGAVTIGFDFTNQLTLVNTDGTPPGTVQADFSYTVTILNDAGALVFASSPSAVNRSASENAPGTVDLPASGSITITSGPLAAGTYTATISGAEHVFINAQGTPPAVPAPPAVALLASGGVSVLGLRLWRRRRAH
jgi:hypothetical protein